MSKAKLHILIIILVLSLLCVLCQKKTEKKKNGKQEIINLNLPEGANCTNKGYNGTCVNAFRCMSLLIGLKLKNYPPLCSYNNDEPVVCCIDCELVDDIRVATFIPELGIYYRNNGRLANRKCLKYLEDLPYNCKNSEPALEYDFDFPVRQQDEEECKRFFGFGSWSGVDGVDASRGEFPHMALLGYGDDLESAQYHCGGSVISEKYILTAAHCISSVQLGPVKYVALGILKRTDPSDLWQRYDVKKIIPHPEYKSPSKYHDIALLEVEEEIEFGETVLPACLNIDRHQYLEEVAHDYFFKRVRQALNDEKLLTYATGWGRLGENRKLADTLQKIKLEKYNDVECSNIYQVHRNMKRGYDNDTQMCYGDYTGFADTCSGDSGGPLQVSVRANVFDCQFKIIGIVSSGNPCGSKGGAGLYTRVDHYVPWIESVVWPNEI